MSNFERLKALCVGVTAVSVICLFSYFLLTQSIIFRAPNLINAQQAKYIIEKLVGIIAGPRVEEEAMFVENAVR